MSKTLSTVDRGQRSTFALAALLSLALVLFVGLLGLGTWQVYRRAWKLDLISRVDQRVHAAAVAAPGVDQWPHITAAADEYRHVRVTGRYLDSDSTQVMASTSIGSGFWLLTPLQMADGNVVLINRGFVPPDWKAPAPSAANGAVTITGLLRLSEPRGGFLRKNDPTQNRWFSRDVPAIANARALSHVAPYFIDADASTDTRNRPPVGGLTVIAFPNNHLVYAITWYALALMLLLAVRRFWREEQRLRRTANTLATR